MAQERACRPARFDEDWSALRDAKCRTCALRRLAIAPRGQTGNRVNSGRYRGSGGGFEYSPKLRRPSLSSHARRLELQLDSSPPGVARPADARAPVFCPLTVALFFLLLLAPHTCPR